MAAQCSLGRQAGLVEWWSKAEAGSRSCFQGSLGLPVYLNPCVEPLMSPHPLESSLLGVCLPRVGWVTWLCSLLFLSALRHGSWYLKSISVQCLKHDQQAGCN